MKKVELYSDGACSGNPGPGGWGCILVYNGHEKKMSGCILDEHGNIKITNNNYTELMGVIVGLQALKEPCEVVVTTDSTYVTDAFNKGWIDKWQMNGWRGDRNKAIKNEDLWKLLLAETRKHSVTFVHIQGHAGHHYNERCDKLARHAIKDALQKKAI